MTATIELRLYELIDEKGKVDYLLLTPKQSRLFRKNKSYKKVIAAKKVKTFKLRLQVT